MPVDFLSRRTRIRADGRVPYDLTFCRAKTPNESRYAWSRWKVPRAIPAAEALRAPGPAVCLLAKGS